MRFEMKVFPHTVKNGKVVLWNTIIYKDEEMGFEFYKRLAALGSPELARANGENFMKRMMGGVDNDRCRRRSILAVTSRRRRTTWTRGLTMLGVRCAGRRVTASGPGCGAATTATTNGIESCLLDGKNHPSRGID